MAEVQGQDVVLSALDPREGKGAEIQRLKFYSSPNWSPANWSLSPDGNKIAIVEDKGPASEVRILTLADRKVVTLALQGWRWTYVQSVAWSADGNHLFATAYSDASTVLLFIDLSGKLQILDEVPPSEAWLFAPVPSPDGHYLAYMKRSYESNVMMLENF